MTDKNLPNIVKLKASRAYSCGDVHGSISSLKNFIETYDIRDSVIFLCGDNGMGFASVDMVYIWTLKGLNDVCEEYNVTLVLLRGNHEDPSWYLDGGKFPELKNIVFVEDYTVVNVEHPDGYGVNVLCVGGAASIDRAKRFADHARGVNEFIKYHPKENLPREQVEKMIPLGWWEGEEPVYDEEKLDVIKSINPIDYIATHTAPSFCPKPHSTIPDCVCDYDKQRAREEREVMDKIYCWAKTNRVGLKAWYYGHFHEHNTTEVDDVVFYGLDEYKKGKFDVKEMSLI